MPREPLDLSRQVDFLSVLDEQGRVDAGLDPGLPGQDLLALYRTMLLARRFDERMIRLQRQGRLGTLAPSQGQEAASLGSCYALRQSDWMVPYIRELAGMLWRGWKMEQFLYFYAGYEEGNVIPEEVNDLPICVPIASQIPHVTGLAWGAKLRGDETVVLGFFGDGATSEGDFHEALNFATVFQVPAVFLCVNNQYAISLPISRQTHSRTIAQKAFAYDMPALRVDGNDVLAVYVAAREAIERARAGGGPTLIEAVTYRLSYHTTADDPTRYRRDEEVRAWEKKDPLLRMSRYLRDQGLMDEAGRERLQEEIDGEISGAVERFESQAKAEPVDMFDHTFAETPPSLQRQRREVEEELRQKREQESVTT